MSRPVAPSGDVDALRTRVSGTVIGPTDAAYDEARQVWNAVVDRRPAAIVRVADAADVAQAVTFARDAGLPVTVRAGGHSMAGHGVADGAVVIDLRELRALHIDPDRRLAWAGAGLTAGEYGAAVAAHGLATPFGDTGTVGIAGLTLGGGIGWLARKHGLTIDALVSAELVTSDGRIQHVSEDSHPDLFWAIRGGGGNFGVVTRLQYRLHQVGTILGGAIFLPATRDVLAGLVPVAAAAPEELTTIAFVMPAPPAPFIPAEFHGTPTVAVMFVYAGDPATGQGAVAPIRALATPIAEAVAPMPYPAIYDFTAEAGKRGPATHRSLFLDALDDDAIDTILERTAAPSSSRAMTQIRVLGGAIGRVPGPTTAFAHRERQVLVMLITPFDDPAAVDRHAAWTHAYYEALAPRASGVYVNFLEDEGEARIRAAYPAGTYERLAAIKGRYDPANVFRGNQNIPPAGLISQQAG